MLIVTLPAVHQEELMEQIIAHPLVGGVRYNVGAVSPYSPKETLERVLELTGHYGKKFWLDLKGRQLRIVQWAVPTYGKIILNHEIQVDVPAKVFFRGNEWSELKVVRGNTIYVDPPPLNAVGQGQAINIQGENLKIHDYLTDEDVDYIQVASDLQIHNYMLSFVEGVQDVNEVQNLLEANSRYDRNLPTEFVLKIESPKGLALLDQPPPSRHDLRLMAACDDLMINIGENKARMLPALEKIIEADPEAIAASRIFSGLEKGGEVMLGDWSHLRLLKQMGYKNFMLSDGISIRHFDNAIRAWQDFLEIFGEA